jgi:hypothetical protein
MIKNNNQNTNDSSLIKLKILLEDYFNKGHKLIILSNIAKNYHLLMDKKHINYVRKQKKGEDLRIILNTENSDLSINNKKSSLDYIDKFENIFNEILVDLKKKQVKILLA